MAHIQRRKTKTGEDRYRVAARVDGKIRWQTFEDPTGAAEFAALVDRIGGAAAIEILNQRRGSPSGGAVPTVAEAIADHIDHLAGVQEGTIDDYRRMARRFADSALGPLPVDALTQDAVNKWAASQTAAAKTIRNRHGLLYAAMERQVELGNIPANPCRKTRIGETERQEMVILTYPEFDGIREILRPHWRPLVTLLVGTGLRFGEATALQPRDFDMAHDPPTLRVARSWKFRRGKPPVLGPPKTRMGRRLVSLGPEVVEAVAPLLARRDRDEFVFTNLRGDYIRQNSFHEIWSRARDDAADAGITTKRPRVHDLRHTHASWLIARGVPLPVIRVRLGHESITTTVDTYGHMSEDALSVAAQAASLAMTPTAPEIEASAEIVDAEVVD